MNGEISKSHPLHEMHRRRPNEAGRSDAEIFRQWGRARLVPESMEEPVVAGSYQSPVVVFTVGSIGMDENAGIKLSFRHISDMERLQTDDPSGPGYVSAMASNGATLHVEVLGKGHWRPFQPTVSIHVRDAGMRQGDTITVHLGNRDHGGPGWRQQTFAEESFPVRVSVDPLGTHEYEELPRDLGWDIEPGPLDRLVIVGPSDAVVGQQYIVRVKAEDCWGNPLRGCAGSAPEVLALGGAAEEERLALLGCDDGVWSYAFQPRAAGVFRFIAAGTETAHSNAMRAVESARLGPLNHYWCDLHGQTGETVGAGVIRDYFFFARHFSFLDGCVHQGNDFQISRALWEHFKARTEAAYEAGEFVTFHGYEWSGTTAMGGDHNVLFNEPDPPIYRSTGWLAGNPFEETAPLVGLYDALRPHTALTIAHIGGRPASLEVSDPEIEPLLEVHSAWGTFEWAFEEAYSRGFKVGIVANSDGHKCRPGTSYPGAGEFGTLGGLTCVLARRKDRDSFWEALKARRCYGTTGQRIIIDASLNGAPMGADVAADNARIEVSVVGTAPVRTVELLRGSEVIETWFPAEDGKPDTALVRFGGARVKGRARMVRWRGSVALEGNAWDDVRINGIFSPTYGLRRIGDTTTDFECVTTGNMLNLQFRPRHGMSGSLRFESNVASGAVDLAKLTQSATRIFQAPLDQRVEALAIAQSAMPLEAHAIFDVPVSHVEERPYFIRVTQVDEAKAWTSPFFVSAAQRS